MGITNKTIIKKLLLSLILVILICNFVMPTQVQAVFTAGDLAQPIFQFIAWLGDVVINFLQTDVAGLVPMGTENNIRYSLGNIFANKISIFDINFIEPNEYEQEYDQSSITEIGSKSEFNDIVNRYGFPYGEPLPSSGDYQLGYTRKYYRCRCVFLC